MGELILPVVSRSKGEIPWQVEIKSIEDKWSHLFKNELYADTLLWVGEDSFPIRCHKVILILNSPVFESMLSSRWSKPTVTSNITETKIEEPKIEFQLPEDDPTLCRLLISCFYNGQPSAVEETLELLLLAKKYICPHVVQKCTTYLKAEANEKNIIQIYQTAAIVEESDLIRHAENFILSKACHLVRLGEFSRFNYDQLKYFLSHDDLNVDEVDLFNAVYRWGQLECSRLGLDSSKAENLTSVLEKIFPLIRFPCMSIEDFTVHVVSKNILPLEQTVQIYKFLTTPVTARKDSISCDNGVDAAQTEEAGKSTSVTTSEELEFGFNTHARSRKIFSYIFKRLKGYGFNFGRKWQNFAFQVDSDIKLVSIGFFRSVKPNVELNVGIRILNYDMTEVYGHIKDEIVTCTLDEDIFYVKFPKPIRIAKDKLYTISYRIQGEDTLYKYGEPIQVQLACSTDLKLSFTFKEALTDTDMDQVPEFCFQL